MSRVIKSGYPAATPVWNAPTTPPAGPLSTVLTGCSAAMRAVMLPPEDCITRSSEPREFSSSFKYRAITGPT